MLLERRDEESNPNIRCEASGLTTTRLRRINLTLLFKYTNIYFPGVRGGELVASSPIVNITKEIMGRTGILEEGVMFPENVRFTIPMTTFAKKRDDETMTTWKRPVIKIMQKISQKDIEDDDEITTEFWTDITANNDSLFDPVAIQKGKKVSLDARIPCQLLIFIFSEMTTREPREPKDDVTDLCEEIERRNQLYNVAMMVHQKIEKPQIISKSTIYQFHAASVRIYKISSHSRCPKFSNKTS